MNHPHDRQTDRQTDGWTDVQTDGIAIAYVRLAYMLSRAKTYCDDWLQNVLFYVLSGTSLARHTHFEPSLVAVRRAVRSRHRVKNTKNARSKFAHMPPVGWSFTKFCMMDVPDTFLHFEFHQVKMYLWRTKIPFAHWKGTSLIQQLVASIQAAIYSPDAIWNSEFVC